MNVVDLPFGNFAVTTTRCEPDLIPNGSLYVPYIVPSASTTAEPNSDEATRLKLILDGNVDVMKLAKARMQTITYLLGCGVSPERFQANQKLVLESVFAQSGNTVVGDRTSRNLVLIGTLIVQAMNVLDEVNDISEQQKVDILSYVGYLSQSGETVEAALGWDKPAPKKRAKK